MSWWRDAVIYQVYPRSFRDSNADGVGDLRGIESGLDHISELGADALWMSPIYPSPLADFGYDVADYEGVDPAYGTLEDFDRLVASAHARGLKLLMDLVPCHTSIQHPWFTERPDFYIWADGKGDGPPNNWVATFGGPDVEVGPLGEPRVLDRRVARHQVHQQLESTRVRGGHQPVEVLQRPVGGVHALVVGHVVAEIGQRRWVDGRHPQGIGAQLGDVVESRLDSAQVAHSVCVGVSERTWIHLVDHGVPPPAHSRILLRSWRGASRDGPKDLVSPRRATPRAKTMGVRRG